MVVVEVTAGGRAPIADEGQQPAEFGFVRGVESIVGKEADRAEANQDDEGGAPVEVGQTFEFDSEGTMAFEPPNEVLLRYGDLSRNFIAPPLDGGTRPRQRIAAHADASVAMPDVPELVEHGEDLAWLRVVSVDEDERRGGAL